jgi:hypothetical protein
VNTLSSASAVLALASSAGSSSECHCRAHPSGMGGGVSHPSGGMYGPPSGGPQLHSRACVACPACGALLMPPPGAPTFYCPCGAMLRLPTLARAGGAAGAGRGGSGMGMSMGGGVVGGARMPHATGSGLDARIMRLLRTLPVEDPRRRVLESLLAVPRLPDGRVNVRAYRHRFVCRRAGVCVARGRGVASRVVSLCVRWTFCGLQEQAVMMMMEQLDQTLNGAPRSLVESLPTRAFKKGSAPKGSDDTEDRNFVECSVCMCDYEDGEELRTLPCLHYFHTGTGCAAALRTGGGVGVSTHAPCVCMTAGCIDKWLSAHKSCPLCKTQLDARMFDGL